MKAHSEFQTENYDLGLSRIRAAIEQSLIEAGAKMQAGCVSRPGWRTLRRATAAISAVPLNGPRVTVEFTTDEIVASWVEFNSGVQHKIGLYAAGFFGHHLRNDRSAFLSHADPGVLSVKIK